MARLSRVEGTANRLDSESRATGYEAASTPIFRLGHRLHDCSPRLAHVGYFRAYGVCNITAAGGTGNAGTSERRVEVARGPRASASQSRSSRDLRLRTKMPGSLGSTPQFRVTSRILAIGGFFSGWANYTGRRLAFSISVCRGFRGEKHHETCSFLAWQFWDRLLGGGRGRFPGDSRRKGRSVAGPSGAAGPGECGSGNAQNGRGTAAAGVENRRGFRGSQDRSR